MNHGLKIRRRVGEAVIAEWQGQRVTVTLVEAARGRVKFEIAIAGFQEFATVVVEDRQSRVDLTIGSALDIYGGDVPYDDVVAWQRREEAS